MTPKTDKSVWDEFYKSIPDLAGARINMKAWTDAWGVVLDAANDPEGSVETMVRSFYLAMRERGIMVPWPLRFGNKP